VSAEIGGRFGPLASPDRSRAGRIAGSGAASPSWGRFEFGILCFRAGLCDPGDPLSAGGADPRLDEDCLDIGPDAPEPEHEQNGIFRESLVMSGPIVRRYGFPNFEKIFGERPVEHGVEESESTEPRPGEADSAGSKPQAEPGKKAAEPGESKGS
jgi:hypothetical protein